MTQVYIMYWEPGSGGDLVQRLLLALPNWSGVIDRFSLDDKGRAKPAFKTEFLKQFSHVPMNWNKRTWAVEDCRLLENMIADEATDYFIVPTHLFEQAEFLKSQIPGSKTLGVTYSKEMFPAVLKNWCKKIAATDPEIYKIYNNPLHQKLKAKGVFGEFVLSEQLKFGTIIKPSVEHTFDFAVGLEELYAGNLHSLRDFVDQGTTIHYAQWLEKQNPLQRYTYNIHPELKKALGYNTQATQTGNQNQELDIYDNILIKHHLSPTYTKDKIPRFKTLHEADNFFSSSKL